MPYKSEAIKLGEKFDRRVKLTQEDKEDIRDLYASGLHSLNSLAKMYNVSKKTILLTVNPESKEKNDERIKNHWKEYYDRDKHNQAIKRLRHYKQELYKSGQIKLED